MTQQPTVGRIVHYQSYGTPGGEYLPEARAAIITTTEDIGADRYQRVGLAVLNPTGLFFNESVPYSEEPQPGHWNWPPRTDTPSAQQEPTVADCWNFQPVDPLGSGPDRICRNCNCPYRDHV